jgi:hypothetical protein
VLATGKMAHDATNLASVMSMRESVVLTPGKSMVAASKAPGAVAEDGAAEAGGAPAAAVSPAEQAAVNKLKKEHNVAFRQLKEKQRIDMSAAMEELEDESIHQAKAVDGQLTEQFTMERKKLAEKQGYELMTVDPSTHDALKKRHAQEHEQLKASQEEARREAQEKIIARGLDKRGKMKAVLEKKALNELRMLKTVQNDQEKEMLRLQEEAARDLQRGDMSREEELKRQKELLMQKLQAREKRLKAKAAKDRELLEQQLQAAAEVERNGLEATMRDREEMLVKRAEDLFKRGIIEPKELDEEVAKIHDSMAKMRDHKLNQLAGSLQAERAVNEKNLAERLGAEKHRALAEATEEVDKLLAAQREAEMAADTADGGEEAKLAPEAQAAIKMMVAQQEQRRQLQEELERQRAKEAEKFATDDASVKAEAQREIARREQERGGQALTDKQKREIFEECQRNAQRMASATTDEQKRQQEEAKKRLDERRRRKEQELNKRHREDMERELKRQDEAEKQKAEALKARIKPIQVVIDEEAKKEEAELAARAERAVNDLERKLKEEKRQLEGQLQADLVKAQEKELAKLKQDPQKKMLELMSRQSAAESMQLKEDEKAALMKQHEQETARLQQALDVEASLQKDKIAELERKQKDEHSDVVKKEEDAKTEFTRAVHIEAEKKLQEREAAGAGRHQRPPPAREGRVRGQDAGGDVEAPPGAVGGAPPEGARHDEGPRAGEGRPRAQAARDARLRPAGHVRGAAGQGAGAAPAGGGRGREAAARQHGP